MLNKLNLYIYHEAIIVSIKDNKKNNIIILLLISNTHNVIVNILKITPNNIHLANMI